MIACMPFHIHCTWWRRLSASLRTASCSFMLMDVLPLFLHRKPALRSVLPLISMVISYRRSQMSWKCWKCSPRVNHCRLLWTSDPWPISFFGMPNEVSANGGAQGLLLCFHVEWCVVGDLWFILLMVWVRMFIAKTIGTRWKEQIAGQCVAVIPKRGEYWPYQYNSHSWKRIGRQWLKYNYYVDHYHSNTRSWDQYWHLSSSSSCLVHWSSASAQKVYSSKIKFAKVWITL